MRILDTNGVFHVFAIPAQHTIYLFPPILSGHMICRLVACCSSGVLAYALQTVPNIAPDCINSTDTQTDISVRRLSVEAANSAVPAESKERTRRRIALIGAALVDAPVLVLLVALLVSESSVVSTPLVIATLIFTLSDTLVALCTAMYATSIIFGLAQYKIQASRLDVALGYFRNSLVETDFATPRSCLDFTDEPILRETAMQ